MPKRPSITATTMSADLKGLPPNKVQKTERSHEENQERAYIAASRRADRSLEARVQSAKMASEIHRRRTGRGLKVSEEIVVKEEMYEEEEDDMPRAYKLLASHLQTSSPEFNSRVSAYISAHTAMATLARYNEVSKIFEDSFPRGGAFQQQFNSPYMAGLIPGGPGSPSAMASAAGVGRPSPISTQPTDQQASDGGSAQTASAGPSPTSPKSRSKGKTADRSGSTSLPNGSSESRASHQPQYMNMPLDPQLARPAVSSFTSELPAQIKMMGNFDMSDPMAANFFGDSSLFDPIGADDSGQKEPSVLESPLETPNETPLETDPATTDSDELSKAGDDNEEDPLFSPAQSSVDYFDGLPSEFNNQFDNSSFGFNPESWENLVNYES